jgi:hypothetical protein
MRIIFILYFLIPAGIYGQGFLSAVLDSTKLITGDPTGLTIVAKIPSNVSDVKLDMNPLIDFGKIEFLAEEPVAKTDDEGFSIYRWKYIVTSFDTGFHILPQVELSYIEQGQYFKIRSQNIGLEVFLLPIRQDEAFLQPIKEIVKEPFFWMDLLPFILGGMLLAIGLFLLLWYLKKKSKKEDAADFPSSTHTVDPFDKALAGLLELEQSPLVAQKLYKDFHFKLSHIFREYIEEKFKYPALESTFEEVKEILSRIQPEDYDLQGLIDVLNKSEFIKFSKFEPSDDFHSKALNQIRDFILLVQSAFSFSNENENLKDQ